MPQRPPNPQPPRPQVTPAAEDHRERFDAQEMALVLSHYDLGVIEHLRPFPRGSRRSPKLRIRSQHGEFLLKRRAPGYEDPYRVAFAHDLQLLLQSHTYPVAGLIGTRGENNSMLQMNGRVYEMFNYIHGTRYDKTEAQAELAGRALGRLHKELASHRPPFEAPLGTFHGATDMDAKLSLIPGAICSVESHADRTRLERACDFLKNLYREAAARVDDAGYRAWPRIVLHGDWHPGNLLYRDGQIVGVLDFDSTRLECRPAEVANAVLQFSLRMDNPDEPRTWPDGLETQLIHALLHGYDQTAECRLADAERKSLPWLMIEALISETVVPIAATGSFARIAGSTFLSMVERKVRWISQRAATLV